jgi:3-oxoacyl-[acyl-carrier protein] reductase
MMPVDSGLGGKTVLVTGGSRGIGRAIVELLADDGATVVFFYRDDRAAAAEVIDAGRAAGRKISAERVDVTDAHACRLAVERVTEAYGGVDVLVNNAGVARDGLLAGLDDEDLRVVMATNVGGVFNVTRAVVPHMLARRAGKIVNVSSVSGDKGGRGQTHYAASKGAVDAFTRALAVELAPRRITVNGVAPGVIETDMSRDIRERAGDAVASRILLRRFGAPREIAYAVWFLASRLADYVTGQVLHVDGGFKME